MYGGVSGVDFRSGVGYSEIRYLAFVAPATLWGRRVFAFLGALMGRRKTAPITLAGQGPPGDVIEREDVRAVALAQPHRRGNDSTLCEAAFGRFCIRQKLNEAIYTAGEMFRATNQRWRNAKGLYSGHYIEPGLGAEREPTADEIKAMRQAITAMETAIAESAAGYLGVRTARHVILDGVDLPGLDKYLVTAMAALAVHLGLLNASGSPFA